MKKIFIEKYPNAIISKRKNKKGDIIVSVNGCTAYNQEDRYSSSKWFTMMENAYHRSLK